MRALCKNSFTFANWLFACTGADLMVSPKQAPTLILSCGDISHVSQGDNMHITWVSQVHHIGNTWRHMVSHIHLPWFYLVVTYRMFHRAITCIPHGWQWHTGNTWCHMLSHKQAPTLILSWSDISHVSQGHHMHTTWVSHGQHMMSHGIPQTNTYPDFILGWHIACFTGPSHAHHMGIT